MCRGDGFRGVWCPSERVFEGRRGFPRVVLRDFGFPVGVSLSVPRMQGQVSGGRFIKVRFPIWVTIGVYACRFQGSFPNRGFRSRFSATGFRRQVFRGRISHRSFPVGYPVRYPGSGFTVAGFRGRFSEGRFSAAGFPVAGLLSKFPFNVSHQGFPTRFTYRGFTVAGFPRAVSRWWFHGSGFAILRVSRFLDSGFPGERCFRSRFRGFGFRVFPRRKVFRRRQVFEGQFRGR
jgi:hypothetical protein